MHLLDTNIISLAISGDREVVRRLGGEAPGEAAISAVTYAEIRYGLGRRPAMQDKRDLFDRLMEHIEVLPWDREAAIAYASERAACEADGESVHHADLMILAHAASAGRTLVTRDKALQRRDRKGPHKTRVVGW
jgi:tRNA(fMet)-specific endonuclease VapC